MGELLPGESVCEITMILQNDGSGGAVLYRAHAILVGATAGVRPNHYGDHGDFRLPGFGLRISYSTRYQRMGAETDSEIAPDKRIESTWEEFRAGRDPVIEWVLSNKQ